MLRTKLSGRDGSFPVSKGNVSELEDSKYRSSKEARQQSKGYLSNSIPPAQAGETLPERPPGTQPCMGSQMYEPGAATQAEMNELPDPEFRRLVVSPTAHEHSSSTTKINARGHPKYGEGKGQEHRGEAASSAPPRKHRAVKTRKERVAKPATQSKRKRKQDSEDSQCSAQRSSLATKNTKRQKTGENAGSSSTVPASQVLQASSRGNEEEDSSDDDDGPLSQHEVRDRHGHIVSKFFFNEDVGKQQKQTRTAQTRTPGRKGSTATQRKAAPHEGPGDAKTATSQPEAYLPAMAQSVAFYVMHTGGHCEVLPGDQLRIFDNLANAQTFAAKQTRRQKTTRASAASPQHSRKDQSSEDEGYRSFGGDCPTAPIGTEIIDLTEGTQETQVKYYGVRRGHHPGVYSEEKYQAEVCNFPGAFFKTCATYEEAQAFVDHPEEDCKDWCCKKARALNEEQQETVDFVAESGHNVFLTGAAGTGKSVTLSAVVAKFQEQGKRVAVVAPTGISALNVDGQTYYTWTGWSPESRKDSLSKLRDDACVGQRCARINDTDVLIIDEISMIENLQFERLDAICRAARSRPADDHRQRTVPQRAARSKHDGNLPFGGIQVIVTGDFFQLGPVKSFSTCLQCGQGLEEARRYCRACRKSYEEDAPYAFDSRAWKSCHFQFRELLTAQRQGDGRMLRILNKLREQKELTPWEIRLLLKNKLVGKAAIQLFARNEEAEDLNRAEFAKLPNETTGYASHDDIRHNPDDLLEPRLRSRDADGYLKALNDHRFERSLKTKVGMQVMLLANIGENLKNGSQGVLVGYKEFDVAELSRTDTTSRGYLPMMGGDWKEYRNQQIETWARTVNATKLPIVRFNNGETRTIYPMCRAVSVGNVVEREDRSLLSRVTLPLVAAWGITIHKSQGLTLERCIVHLDSVFQREQVYVALSRVKSLEGLEIRTRNKLEVLRSNGRLAKNEHVIAYMKSLRGMDDE